MNVNVNVTKIILYCICDNFIHLFNFIGHFYLLFHGTSTQRSIVIFTINNVT